MDEAKVLISQLEILNLELAAAEAKYRKTLAQIKMAERVLRGETKKINRLNCAREISEQRLERWINKTLSQVSHTESLAEDVLDMPSSLIDEIRIPRGVSEAFREVADVR